MSATVTHTKIRIPFRREDLISRDSLIGSPSEILDYAFTLLSAPAGYGKTSLLIDIAHRAPFPVCWYSLDALDKDPLRFFTHLIHAVKVQFPDCGNGFLSLLENLPKPAWKLDQLSAALVNDFYLAIQEHFVIILDDFHMLDDQPEICSFISKLGMEMDDNVHLMISSRKQIWFPNIPLLIGRRQVRGIDQVDLAFNAEEIESFLGNLLDNPISKQRAVELYEQTEGWITGLLMLAHQRPSFPETQNKAVKVTGANIANYYDAQVMTGISRPIREGMVASALLEEFNAQTCQEVFGDPGGISWSALIQTLVENNLFVEVIDNQKPWFRYHQLFKDYLLDEFDRLDRLDRQQKLEKLLAWLSDREEWEHAFATARKLGDPLVMAQVISQASSALFHAGRINLLADWLDSLPEFSYYKFPTLKILKGILKTATGDPISGLSDLNRILNNSKMIDDDSVYYRGLLCRATTNRIIGNYDNSIKDIKTILNKTNLDTISPNLRAEAKRELGLLYNIVGKYEKSLESFSRSLELYESINDPKNSSLVNMDLGLILMIHGKINRAKHHYLKAQVIYEELNNQINLSILYNNLGILSICFGEYSDAMNNFKHGLEFAKNTSHTRMEAFINASIGDLAYAVDMHQTSKEYYLKSLKLAKEVHEAFLITYIEICLSKIYRLLDNYNRAKNNLDSISENIRRMNSDFECGIWNIEKGNLKLSKKYPRQARKYFRAAYDLLNTSNRPFELARSLVGLLIAAWVEQDLETVERELGTFDQLVSDLESLHPLLPEISYHLAEFQELSRTFPDNKTLETLLDQTHRYQISLPDLQRQLFPPLQIGEEADQLTIKAFGGIEVRQAGSRISAPEWIHQKTVRELLYYLLSLSQGATKEQIGLVFWPDSSPELLSCQFKNAVYRLRRALGKESILYDRETRRYCFNRTTNYRYDVEIFQATIRQAEQEHRPARKRDLYRTAAALYQHPFGPELEGVWAEPIRQRLYIEYEEALLWIADSELMLRNYHECLDICLKIIKIDPCQEEAYQLCMKSYSRLGEMTNLQRIYKECRENFSNILSTSPSSQTISLYRRLFFE